jgi:hypothetical protein
MLREIFSEQTISDFATRPSRRRMSALGGKRTLDLTYPVRQIGGTMAAVRGPEFYFPCETNIDSPKRNAPTTMMSAPA